MSPAGLNMPGTAAAASSISLRMWPLTVTGFTLWTTYGVLLESWPVAASNPVCLTSSGVALGLKCKFRAA